jgi:ribosomal protein S27E
MKVSESLASCQPQNFSLTNVTFSQKPDMQIRQKIRCPNCGSHAERLYSNDLTQIECSICDYLMITCTRTGRVIEAYAPGIYASRLAGRTD